MNYTIADFQNISSAIQCSLDSNTLNIIRFIEQQIGVAIESDDSPSSSSSSSMNRRTNGDFKSSRNHIVKSKRSSKSSDETWENVRSFKATKIEAKTGIDKQMNEIRILLNKISIKNFDVQKPIVVENIIKIINSVDENEDQDKNRKLIIETIFFIVISNKMLSDVYASVYTELTKDLIFGSIFKEMLLDFVEKYIKSIDHINYVDQNIDYDEFCKYNKINDSRKVSAQFIVHLMKYNIIDQNKILSIIDEFQNRILQYMDQENKTNEVEEITENIFILVSLSKTVTNITDNEFWINTILPTIKRISSFKMKEHISLSSRVIFKYMDL